MSASLLNWLGDDTSGEILPAEKKTKNTENSRAKLAAPRKTARSKKTDETEHTVQKDSELKSEYTADPDYVPTLTDVRISARKIECVSDELRRSICVDLEGTRSSLEELKKICSDRSGDVKLQSSLAELKKNMLGPIRGRQITIVPRGTEKNMLGPIRGRQITIVPRGTEKNMLGPIRGRQITIVPRGTEKNMLGPILRRFSKITFGNFKSYRIHVKEHNGRISDGNAHRNQSGSYRNRKITRKH